MKAQKKAIAGSIASAVKTKLSESTELSKKVNNIIEKSATKLAKKLVKQAKKVDKKKVASEKEVTKVKGKKKSGSKVELKAVPLV